jgi:hypothetical protein
MSRKFFAAVATALLFLLTGTTSAAAAAGGTDRPFRASASGDIVYTENTLRCMAGFTTVVTAAGKATHLGAFTLTARHCEVPTSETTGQSIKGEMTLTAANGDHLFGTYETQWVFSNGTVSVAGDLTVTGGTGRFDGATGTLRQDHVISVTSPSPPWPLAMRFAGSITY